jgi:hypothetical protein
MLSCVHSFLGPPVGRPCTSPRTNRSFPLVSIRRSCLRHNPCAALYHPHSEYAPGRTSIAVDDLTSHFVGFWISVDTNAACSRTSMHSGSSRNGGGCWMQLGRFGRIFRFKGTYRSFLLVLYYKPFARPPAATETRPVSLQKEAYRGAQAR